MPNNDKRNEMTMDSAKDFAFDQYMAGNINIGWDDSITVEEMESLLEPWSIRIVDEA